MTTSDFMNSEQWTEQDVYPADHGLQANFGPRHEKPDFVVWEQQWPRSDCASAQSDLHHCFSPSVKYHSNTRIIKNFTFLASLCSYAESFKCYGRLVLQLYIHTGYHINTIKYKAIRCDHFNGHYCQLSPSSN